MNKNGNGRQKTLVTHKPATLDPDLGMTTPVIDEVFLVMVISNNRYQCVV